MQIGFEGLIILSTLILLAYFTYATFFDDNLEKIKSTIDDREYWVQDRDDAIAAANTIAEIRKRLILLSEHLIRTRPSNDPIVYRVKNNFDPNVIQEREYHSQYTSYTENKGSRIVLCLRNGDQLADINLLMFVALHEYSHIVCDEYGHTPKFWQQFAEILEEAINIGIYQRQNYEKYPQEYCGVQVTSSPLPE